MNVHDYLRILRKRWPLVALATLVCLATAGLATLLATPTYQSQVKLFVSARGSSTDISGSYTGSLFTQQRVKSYADVVNSPLVTGAVVDQLKLGMTAEQLAEKVSASVPLDTTMLDVTVTDTSPTRARDIAAAVAQQFIRLVPQIEAGGSGSASPVKVTVVTPATVNDAPVSPRTKVNLALGLLLGLAIGVGAAVLRETLDTSVKTAEDIQELSGAAPLGTIAFDPSALRRPLVVTDGTSARAEAFRQVRTNLQFVDVDHPPRSVVISSAMPGEGKSTTSANLAITLAEAGRDVILVEADLRRPRLAEYMRVEGAVGLTNVLVGEVELEDVLQPWGRHRLRVLPSGAIPPNPSEMLGSQQMREVLHQLLRISDVVVLDAPPLLPVTDAAVLARSADGILLVTRHGMTKKEQLAQAIENVRAVNARLLGVLLNAVPTKGPDAHSYTYSHYYDSHDGKRRRLEASSARAAVVNPAASTPASPAAPLPSAAGSGLGHDVDDSRERRLG